MAIIDGVSVSGTVYGLRDNDTSGGIASTFSASTAYTAGQYVWYDSGSGAKLYRFTADHAAGAWTGTDATEVKLGADVSDLKSAINDPVNGIYTAPVIGTWVIGEIKSSGSNGSSTVRIRLNTYDLYLPKNAIVICNNADYQISTAEYSAQSAASFIQFSETTWNNKCTIKNDAYVRIVMRYADNRAVSSDDLSAMPLTLTVFQYQNLAYRFSSVEGTISKNSVAVDKNFTTGIETQWEIGSIAATGGNSTSSIRIRTSGYLTGYEPGDVIVISNDDLDISLHEYSAESSASQTYTHDWSKMITIHNGGYIRLVIRYNDNRTMTSEDCIDLPEQITVYRKDGLALRVLKNEVAIDALENSPESYYMDELTDTISKVRSCITGPSIVFLWITDIHRFVAAVQNFEQSISNMIYFKKHVDCDFILNTGDNTEGNVPQMTTMERAYGMTDAFLSVDLPYIFSNGNHDNNPYYILDGVRYPFNIEQVYQAYYTQTKADRINVSENGTDFYIDYDALNVRLISINADNPTVANTYAYGSTTNAFLTSALNTDKAVLLVSHVTSVRDHVYGRQQLDNGASIQATLEAFVSNGGKLIELSGHSHLDMAFIAPWMSIMQGCEKFEHYDSTVIAGSNITGYIDEIISPDRTAQTASEDLWSVCVYKPYSHDLDLVRFGAGSDRYFHVAPIAPTTLTTKLSGTVIWSSSDTAVATVADGVVTGVATGKCAVLAKDASGNYECWIISVP